MNWVKARERLPLGSQEVLVRHKSIVDLAVFDEKLKKFMLKNGSALDKEEDLQWLSLGQSGVK
jgi:hypothetical protein